MSTVTQNGPKEKITKPAVLSLKNENSLSYENIELTTNTEDNNSNNNNHNNTSSQTTATKSPLLGPPVPLKQQNDVVFERKTSRTSESITGTSKINAEKRGSGEINTPPSECYFYLVKPRVVPGSTKYSDELFEKNQFNSNAAAAAYKQKTFSFDPEPVKQPASTQPQVVGGELEIESKIKNVLDNCFDQLSKNKKIDKPCVYIGDTVNNPNFSNLNGNRTTSISSSSIDTNGDLNQQHLKNTQMLKSPAHITNNIDSSNMNSFVRKQETIVERMPNTSNDKESSSNTVTNTFLLNGDTLNDLNDFYSLKITFV